MKYDCLFAIVPNNKIWIFGEIFSLFMIVLQFFFLYYIKFIILSN